MWEMESLKKSYENEKNDLSLIYNKEKQTKAYAIQYIDYFIHVYITGIGYRYWINNLALRLN